MKKLRRFIRKCIRNAGFQRKIAPDFVDVMHEHNINVVLDVGANDGDYGREIRDRGYRGLIVSFEPNPMAYDRLKLNIQSDKKWVAFPYALGDKNGFAKLSIAENDVMSSFKGLTDFGRSIDTKTTSTVLSKILTIDSFFDEHPEFIDNVYLKIDTQGFEMEVLRGAKKNLEKITAVQAEIALVQTYLDQTHWLEIVSWIREQKFELATIVCNSAIGAQVREFDFVFIKNNKII